MTSKNSPASGETLWFAKLCIILFNKKLDEVDFMEALSADLGFEDRNHLIFSATMSQYLLKVADQ